ncbi:MAG: DUF4202 domain-containing protein [Burkholderiales bacterium]
MTAEKERFLHAIERFDAANGEDPNRTLADGREQPKELLYGRRLSAMLERFAPEAPEALRLAVRCQHIQRWRTPRDTYPRTPLGYQQWRTQLMKFHAETAGRILREVGYEEAMIGRVKSLVRKEGLKRDPDCQTLEDVVDLVFLENYLADFVASHPDYDEAKFADILNKTWKKMSTRGHEAALSMIKLPEHLLPVIHRAVLPGDG